MTTHTHAPATRSPRRATGGAYRLPRDVIPVGVFRRGVKGVVRDVVARRSLEGLRPQRHRSGWPLVVDELARGAGDDGILLDDFVERTFHPAGWGTPTLRERAAGVSAEPIVWHEPWIGVFHYPPSFPEWYQDHSHPNAIMAAPRFVESRAHLRGAIALSQYLADWLEPRLSVPVLAVKHPTAFPTRTFSWESFSNNPDRSLVQVGWFLRNHRGIYQVATPDGIGKKHLVQDRHFVREAEERTDRYSPVRSRPDVGTVERIEWVGARAYDELFTRNLIFLELFDASANNVVIEAIARTTPIVVNRHPAVMEYLGDGYPLAYDDIADVPGLLDMARIRDAHQYLRAMDTHDLTVEHFVGAVDAFAAGVR